jgi:RNA polymerase sigma factor (sigma-70 family)
MPPSSGETADERLEHDARGAEERNELVAGLQALDRDAWKALYLENRRLVRGVLASRVGYGAELEDLTQQVFATAALLVRDGKAVLRGDAAGLRSWLAAIAHRLGLSERRRQRSAGAIADDEDAASAQAQADPEARQTLRHARAIWEKLPDRLQDPWLLRRLERMTISEIAAALSISPATAKRRIAEADARFAAMADRDPVLRDYVRHGEST